jgi:hypothetical protein
MSVVHPEGRLQFSFDDDWSVLKWDAHPAYRDGLQRFQKTTAVDFVGLYLGAPWFIEVKDFRDHRIENKGKLKNGELAAVVACKVRDTLAALIWSRDRPLSQDGLDAVLRAVCNRTEKVPVVLWLEEDGPVPSGMATALEEEIKRRLRWLNAKVSVVNRTLAKAKPLPGLMVTSLP